MEPRDLLKRLHPDQFSDSKEIDKVECSREILDFQLSRLSEQNMHFNFEEFIRKLLEREICPNLIEETGPAGGGDGKVDTENFPVSKKIQKFWWYGLNTSNDRWAFAISLKKTWKTKCNSDIKKIIDTKRGYTKIFFVTNQAIKNDKRLEYQDAKKEETGLDIIILDKTWILEKALDNKNLDLLVIIGITTPIKEKQTGINDLKKQRRIFDIEKKLQDYSVKEIINKDVIDLAIESAILSRDLEEDEVTVVGKFNRALRMAREKNDIVDERNILYDLAWYYHWWLNDEANFEKYYMEYQYEVSKDKKIEEILKLATLWTLEYTRKQRDKKAVKEKTEVLLKLLKEKESSKSRVTQLEAKTKLCFVNIFLEENINKQFKELIAIVEEAKSFKEYDFITLSKMVENLLPVFNDNDDFIALYDLITEELTTRKADLQKADMYLKRAKMLSSSNNHYDAINILGKCLTLLYKDESDGKLVEAYLNIGGNFEAIGLKYAAKNYYIAAISVFFDIFLKDNTIDAFSIKVVNVVIDLEIQQGNVEQAIKWFEIKNILLSVLLEKNEQINLDEENEYFQQREALISSSLLSTKVEDFNMMNIIIDNCRLTGLNTAEVMAKYVIGEYDEQMLKECNGDKNEFDKIILSFYKDSLLQGLPEPIFLNGKDKKIQSWLNGNKIVVKFKATRLGHRFSEFIIALLENTLATMHINSTFMRGDIILELQERNTGEFSIDYSFDGIDTYTIMIDTIEMYDINIENHKIISDFLFKLLANILAISFIYKDYEETLKKLLVDDQSFERSINHTNTIYNLNKIFGSDEENKNTSDYKITRKVEWYSGIEIENSTEEFVDPFEDKDKIKYKKDEKKRFKNVSHDNIFTSGLIKTNHWDIAQWKGTMYIGDLINKDFIKIGFLFENESGAKKVFQDLIDIVGRDDKEGKIILSFIKGINKNRIYDYRIMIMGKAKIPRDVKENYIVQTPTRIHEMNCDNDRNINVLENIIKNGNKPKITILPIIKCNDSQINPLTDYEIKLSKVNIKQAYEIGKGDAESMAIKKDDDPIIPSEVENAPIKELLELIATY